ncbi:lisH domain-containing protein ARMC9-like [Daphnia pulicaria]|uniref:lisH domain-containing protein ARMC9-like n=1 Tax=Daphnia pulicaria TaxID=35523 RepID=UPI001EEBB29F|nr:lisH domain-containing protein ARMC9-like [Daphnia pulicaria]
MEDYVCCRELAQQLDEHFLKGDGEKFFEVWESLVGKPEESLADPNYDLFLLVDFKLQVYFTVFQTSINNAEKKARKKFSNFLQEKGSVYSKFNELAPYFAIPYIENQNHFLLNEILKDEWVQHLKTQWKDYLEKRITHIHGDDKIRLEQQNRKYFNLKAKFTKLKDDHKSLLDLATRLVAALEESIRGDTKCSLETFENYNQQIMIYSHSLLKTNISEGEQKSSLEVGFQWEARSLRTSTSVETIGSKNSL